MCCLPSCTVCSDHLLRPVPPPVQGGELLCCDGCNCAFHTECVNLQEVPTVRLMSGSTRATECCWRPCVGGQLSPDGFAACITAHIAGPLLHLCHHVVLSAGFRFSPLVCSCGRATGSARCACSRASQPSQSRCRCSQSRCAQPAVLALLPCKIWSFRRCHTGEGHQGLAHMHCRNTPACLPSPCLD